ncbi:leucyl aminopeptidase family protein [Colwellia psychrerythraea]|uniref:Peptidase M17 leucyl aminopeptidase domain protein n=1 Tax=Colwellia psychrerythraea TaxID=28229 RepID=A0A099KJM6_COLPS|nr:leucyl aminopeptidase family protein [Colwellia psychrerythraea]KGJ91024.1 peptidase M17 leucyl aminopeptidase domain protein [Colwellia psychrerythraea]
MNNLLNAENSGTPLIIIEKSAYPEWFESQEKHSQTWLSNTQFKGRGLSLIPNNQGELSQVLFVVADASDYFACGDLIKQLPQGQYLLQAESEHVEAISFGWLVGAYQFDRYISDKSEKALATLAINNVKGNIKIVANAIKFAQATALTRDLINTPAADMMPEDIAQASLSLAEQFGGEVKQIIGDDLLVQNYPTIHAVGRASIHTPRLVDLTWGDSKNPQVTLVGKGVCFDSGGLDMKPAAGMRNMKKDMGGAAHVLGLAQLIMAFNLPINLRVLIPAVENAVSSNALRPGDVVTTRKGLTVEIHNTDAEGRLVLCDALAEAENDEPELIIDFATLTGAMRVALGTELAGFFSTNDQVAADITAAGLKNSDPVWRMPLHKPYDDLFNSTIADMTNCPTQPFGGAITAALYLQRFVEKTDWVHFDVMAFNVRHLSGRPLGGESFGIRAVFDYLETRFK